MPLLREEARKQEKMNGIVYDIETSPDYRHGIVSGNMMCKIKDGLKGTHGFVTMRNLDFKYHPDKNDDYVIPDIMVICDRKHLKGGAYSGTPKFIAETLSPSTALRDRTDKLKAYEEAGVEEYWIVSPQGKSVDIYYLTEGVYELVNSYMLQEDPEEPDYNAKTKIQLKEFPHIEMELQEIFEGLDV